METTDTLAQKLRQSFIAGLLVLLPVFITFKVLGFAFTLVDGVFGPRLNALISLLRFGDAHHAEAIYLPGIGLITTLLMILIIGYGTRYVFFKRIVAWLDAWLERVPIASTIYGAVKQIVKPLSNPGALPFSRVVMVEHPGPGRFALGMLTQEHVDDGRDGADDLVVVFVPTNHLYLGHPIVVPRKLVHPIGMSASDAVKFIVSGGAVLGEALPTTGVLEATRRMPTNPVLPENAAP